MSSDRRFRRAVGRVLIALSFKHSRDRQRSGDGLRPRSLGFECHRPGGYSPSMSPGADRQSASSPPYCTVVLPSPTGFMVRLFYYYHHHRHRHHHYYYRHHCYYAFSAFKLRWLREWDFPWEWGSHGNPVGWEWSLFPWKLMAIRSVFRINLYLTFDLVVFELTMPMIIITIKIPAIMIIIIHDLLEL